MILVYPLKSQNDYTELRYSLRSLRFLSHISEVIVIGSQLPDWLTGVTWINVPDVPGRKQFSIKNKIIAALEYTKKEVLFMNDDVYLLYPQNRFPFYFLGDLKKVGESGSQPLMKQLIKMGKSTKNFDGHYPLIYGTGFKKIVERFSDDTIIKSLYCNYLGIEGVEIPDNKLVKEFKHGVIESFIRDKPSFSTGVNSLQSALHVLQELFPKPSKYEI